MTPSILVFAVLGVASLVTSFLSGILGMAGGMILMGVLIAVLPVPAAMMMHGITQLFPWFAELRTLDSLFAHAFYGLLLAHIYSETSVVR